MHYLIEKLLKKRGLDDTTSLSTEEKKTIDNYQKILTEEINLDKVVEFCRNQVGVIEAQWRNLENTNQKNERLIIAYNIYKILLDLITKPKAEQESLEKYLRDLIDS